MHARGGGESQPAASHKKIGRALARLGDTGGRYCRLWHLRGNVSMSPLAAPMPPGLSWSSPTCLCTPEIAAPSPPGGRWLSISLHAAIDVYLCWLTTDAVEF
jgi:hypothetical protein